MKERKKMIKERKKMINEKRKMKWSTKNKANVWSPIFLNFRSADQSKCYGFWGLRAVSAELSTRKQSWEVFCERFLYTSAKQWIPSHHLRRGLGGRVEGKTTLESSWWRDVSLYAVNDSILRCGNILEGEWWRTSRKHLKNEWSLNRFLGRKYSLHRNLTSASPFFSPLSSGFKYRKPVPTALNRGKDPYLHQLLPSIVLLYHTR